MLNEYVYEYHDENGDTVYIDVTEGMLAEEYLESKLPKTVVYNLDTQTELIYSLSPYDALIAAYEQHKRNYNWITYKNKEDYDFKVIKDRTLILGSFTCAL